MRPDARVLAFAVVALIACESGDPSEVTEPQPSFAAVPDLDGLPDLIVDQNRIASSWVVYEETFSPTGCTAIEGGFEGGTHRTLRFSVSTPNIGNADVFIGDPNRHIDPNGDGDISDSDGLYEYAECHAHFHFRNYATYEILPVLSNGSLGAPIQARKRGFCMIDTTPWQDTEAPHAAFYRSCGRIGVPGNQGISTGWADQYFKWLTGQFFLLTGEDEPISPGNYVIRVTVNPPFTATLSEVCPFTDDDGFCRMFEESDYTNNVAQVAVQVPARVGRTGFGPGGGQTVQAEVIDDESRPVEKK